MDLPTRLAAMARIQALAKVAAKAGHPLLHAAQPRAGGSNDPKAQGAKGRAQGRHGAQGPMAGGKAAQNIAGTLPHQQASVRGPQ